MKSGQCHELRNVWHSLEKEKSMLHATCATEKAASTKCLLNVSPIWREKAA